MRLLAIALLLLSIPPSGRARDADHVPGQIMIQLPPSNACRHEALQALSADFADVRLQPQKLLSERLNIWLLEFAPDRIPAGDLLAALKNHESVCAAQFNHYVKLRATYPDDPYFDEQWALENTGQNGGLVDADIDAPEAWDITTGGVTALGDTIVVAIIDDGADLTHDDLSFWKNYGEIPGNGIDDDNNGYIDDYDGWNAYMGNGTIPPGFHGTPVIGIAAAIGNNGIGISGVTWDVRIMPVAGSSNLESVVIEAYGYVLAMRALYDETNGERGAFIVATNSSFGVDMGDPDDYPLWCAIYDSLGSAGVLSVAATANHDWDIDVVGDMPTSCGSDFLVTVTNTTMYDLKNGDAAYGATTVDLGAPGTHIWSTYIGNSYTYRTGTSMATPHVTGIVALIFAYASPELLLQYREQPAAVALAIKECILDGVDPLSSLDGITVSGGRLNAYNAIELIPRIYSDAPTETPLASKARLLQNHPNPFHRETTIGFKLPVCPDDTALCIRLAVYDITGKLVRTLVDGEKESGRHALRWNGLDDNGCALPSGVYLCRMEADGFSNTCQLVLLR